MNDMDDMKAVYAFSLNGENYTGSFSTRQTALKAALEKATQEIDPPNTIFVGQQVVASPEADGHADGIIERMRERSAARQDGAGDEYLRRVNDQQHADLDAAVENVILAWLKKHELKPTRFNIVAISEHPVPLPHVGSWSDSAEVF